MKEGRHVSLYISYFRSLVSRIGDWGEIALIHHFRMGFYSIILHQLVSHPSRIDSLQDSMDITLQLDTRESSFPSSVHNPSFNSQQSSKSSIDEVVKEIQDFGEDNSVSSLHLFLGNVALPPSSCHQSLEELWDEEEDPEEIETVMKCVTSSYNHYLDVFSKLSAERLPPHFTCDHNIELE
ncbi:hypothetical protein O181_027725 [Austropuccinia psidii MF-1]|uniref:Uncharacterized protein n=1 Tax=Austropuccinia psidii MF-1 TaxID=1389203 RepID=A0A9Q3CRI5_9BASI|nr:hypothetical protein [Austropuccinia psidii MF-1]